VGRIKLFRTKGSGCRKTAFLSVSRPNCYMWFQFPYSSQKLPSSERWFTSVKIRTSLLSPHNGREVTSLSFTKCHSVSVWELLSTKYLLHLCLTWSERIYFPCKQIIK
jgi:hypothetical protein